MKLFKYIIIVLFFISQSPKAQISVYGAVEHIVPDGIDTLGNINLTVSGSTSPYTYTWNPGTINTKDISNITAGQYTVNVRSASSQTLNAYYKIGYKALWTNLYRGIYRNDSLFNINSGSSWFANATSKNTLTSGTDGWFEYVITNLSGYSHWIGFSDSISYNIVNTDIDYGFYYNGAAKDLYTTHTGTTQVLVNANVKIGDVIRLERTGNILKYLINNTAVKTITVTGVSGKTFKLKACLAGSNVLANVGCSFANLNNASVPGYIKVMPFVKHASAIGTTDGIAKVTPAIPFSNTYSWSPSGVTTNSISSLSFGTYSVTIKDSLNNDSKTNLRVGYKTQWTNLDYCYSRNDSLVISTSYTNRWSHAVSKNTLKPNIDGWVEYILSYKGQDCFIGFVDSITPIRNHSGIDYGFYYNGSTGTLYYSENSNYVLLSTYINLGDVLALERVGNTIKYKKNEEVLRSVTVTGISQKPLKVQCNMFGNTASVSRITDVGCSFLEEDSTTLKNYVNVKPIIKHASGPGINDGSIELTPKVSFNNTYSWTPSGSTSSSLTALSFGNYSVMVTDSLQNKSSHTFNVGYKVNWTNMDRCFLRNDSLIGNGKTVQYGTAHSKNTLKPNEDGWFETVVYSITSYDSYIGFADSISPLNGAQSFKAIDYGFCYSTSSGPYINYYQSGTLGGLYSVVRVGDLLRMERIGNTINYKINGVIFKTVTVAGLSNIALKIQANMEYINFFSNVGCSFYDMDSTNVQNYVRLKPVIRHASGPGINDGSISVQERTSGFKTVVWEPTGVSSSTVSSLNVGVNTVTVKDSLENRSSYSFNTSYKAIWTNMSSAIFRNDSLLSTKTSGGYGYARTKNYLDANTDGWFETTITHINGRHYYIGFVDSAANSNSIITDIEYGFWHDATSTRLNSYEPGGYSPICSSPVIGDVIRIERIGNTINYKVNGVILRTVTNSAIGAKVFRVKAMLTQNYFANVGLSVPGCTISANAGLDQLLVTPNSVTLGGSPSATGSPSSFSYTWTPNYYLTSTSIANPIATPLVNTTYTLAVNNFPGCTVYDQVEIFTRQNEDYVKLYSSLNAGYYNIPSSNKLYFAVDGEYEQTGLSFNVYRDADHSIVTGLSTSSGVISNGDNRYFMNVSGLSSNYYILEIQNQKKEKLYLRFKK